MESAGQTVSNAGSIARITYIKKPIPRLQVSSQLPDLGQTTETSEQTASAGFTQFYAYQEHFHECKSLAYSRVAFGPCSYPIFDFVESAVCTNLPCLKLEV